MLLVKSISLGQHPLLIVVLLSMTTLLSTNLQVDEHGQYFLMEFLLISLLLLLVSRMVRTIFSASQHIMMLEMELYQVLVMLQLQQPLQMPQLLRVLWSVTDKRLFTLLLMGIQVVRMLLFIPLLLIYDSLRWAQVHEL